MSLDIYLPYDISNIILEYSNPYKTAFKKVIYEIEEEIEVCHHLFGQYNKDRCTRVLKKTGLISYCFLTSKGRVVYKKCIGKCQCLA